ncbi:MAG: tetratricopeptide repeat protein [Gemmatimonadota bacterium]|nr:tetratricopeptide repeat protein [Gemmatimonadota bacterium]
MQTTGIPAKPKNRRWHAPPPLVRAPGEGVRGLAVLEEFADEPGALLWRALRSVTLWTEASVAERESLFLRGSARRTLNDVRAADLPPEVKKPLRVIARMMGDAAATPAQEVADACAQLARWADGRGKLETALAFMQAAALAAPDDARAAYETGRFARRGAEYTRASGWFEEALSRALRLENHAVHALAHIGMGNLHLQRGNFPKAQRSHTEALEIARRYRLREIEGMACHDLFVIADESSAFTAAENWAAAALHAYGPAHPRLVNLAHDVAVFWMNRGEFARALPVMQAVLPHLLHDPLLPLGNLARAAGAVGDRKTFAEAWERLWQIVRRDVAGEHSAQALLDFAHGAASLQEWSRAEEASALALRHAAQRKLGQVQIQAEAVHEQVRTRRLAVKAASMLDASGDALAAEFVSSLRSVPVAV